MNEPLQAKTAVANRQRVKHHRARRRAAGLKEIKFWVREKDMGKVLSLLAPFLKAADNCLHAAEGGQWPKNKLTAKDKLLLDQ